MDNMELWDKFKETNPKYTKSFKRGGGFSGTATDPMYIVMRMTEQFGPNGIGWGWEILDEAYIEGAPLKKNEDVKTIIHKIQLHLWYMGENLNTDALGGAPIIKHYTSPQFGLTTFVGEYSTAGIYTDEEHAKKSVTDAISKCAVQLGIAADIHMGKYDDNKYVKSLHDKFDGKNDDKQKAAPKDKSKAGVDDIPLGAPGSSKLDPENLSDEERKKKGWISKKQIGRLFKIAKEQGWPYTAIKSLFADWGYNHSYEIKWQDYKGIVEQIESLDMNEEPKDKELEDIPI